MREKLLRAFEFARFVVLAASLTYGMVQLDLSANARERFAGNFMTVCVAVFIVAAIMDYATKRIPASWKAAARSVRQAVKEVAKLIWERTGRAREISVPVSFLLGVILLVFDAYRTGRITQHQVETAALILLVFFLVLLVGTLVIKFCFWVGSLLERLQEQRQEHWHQLCTTPTLSLPRSRQ